MLAAMKRLRGTPFDPFGYTAERKMERALIKQYEADMQQVLPLLTDATRDAVVALAELPMQIKGFGPVKQANEAKAAKRREGEGAEPFSAAVAPAVKSPLHRKDQNPQSGDGFPAQSLV